MPDAARTPVERLVEERRERPTSGPGRPFTNAAMLRERTAEAYLFANEPPRWMQRLLEIERGLAETRRDLARSYMLLREECGDDASRFARRWAERVSRWPFDDLNELIRTHNEWYPVERSLPMDPRTGNYVLVGGRSYLRRELDAAWALEQFPAGW